MVLCREGIVRWVAKQLGPVADSIDTPKALKEYESTHNVVVIGYFKEFSDSDEAYATFKKAAMAVDVATAQTTSKEVAKAAGNLAVGSFAMIKSHAVRACLLGCSYVMIRSTCRVF
jgi:hypothetical protein